MFVDVNGAARTGYGEYPATIVRNRFNTRSIMAVAPHSAKDQTGFRSMAELAICFVITLSVLRGFFLEGYLVSTGSMAPVLLGFHKRVECPSCQYNYACGVRFDQSVGGSVSAENAHTGNVYTSCPNCGQIDIDIARVPRNHGDQLLVHKNVFDFRRPRRWEPVVFCNPGSPGEAYVKRVVGLPGEELQVIDGDVFINGRIARKDLVTQRNMRIPVSDLGHVPDDPNWELSWRMEGNWTVHADELCCSADGIQHTENVLSFRHWRWFGGNHTVETPLPVRDAYPDWTDFLQRFKGIPVSWIRRLDFDEQTQVLRCHGVMPDEMQSDLMASATNDVFRRAIYRLAALSHLAPVTDRYGYNTSVTSAENVVSDMMLKATITIDSQPAEIIISIPVEAQVYLVRLNMKTGRIELTPQGSDEVLRTSRLESAANGFEIEASNFDHRLTVAIDGKNVFRPLDLPAADTVSVKKSTRRTLVPLSPEAARADAEVVERQQRFGLMVFGGRVRIGDLQMYRDVHYTQGRGRHAVETKCKIAADSYFVQGDNSPVSYDSRSWVEPFVPHRLLVGKPFVVHLPSRPGRLKLGKREISIRIPDFQRIRYIQ
ncbi:MAG: S26 family signal peptidase [Fuerstiella sp.]|nr:S26 family signal peptidase [Fuerstiella sp.]